MSLASAGTINAELCILMVAGANVGGAIPPILAVASQGAVARQVAVSNLLVRSVGAGLLLLTASWIVGALPAGVDVPQLAIQTHLLFNLALAVGFLPAIGPLSVVMKWIEPERRAGNLSDGPKHLDEAALAYPPSALAAAMRETLRVGDIVEEMLDTTLTALKTNDELLCQGVFKLDDRVDAIQGAIKLYLARMDRKMLDQAGQRQLNEILTYAVNLEHVGDIVERSLSRLTIKKIEHQLTYSPEGMQEIEDLFRDTIENLQLAQRVFINRDAQIARRLMEAKVTIRQKERLSVERHMARLQERRPETLQTTSMHMDVLRDLKRINGHLISVATPILEEAGLMRESRLKKG
jgi:phosphate:Na+ symporter